MKTLKRHNHGTQDRLLESACTVFADKGYRDATIAEICDKAGANRAAVNYYFRDKDTLYVEAWRLAFHRSLEAHPPDGGVPPDAPAEQRLRGRVLSIISRMADPSSNEFDIVHKERANPSGLLAEVMRESIEPIRQQMSALVRELLGDKATEQQVQLCQLSIIAQCFHVIVRRHHLNLSTKNRPTPGPPLMDFSVETMADHIVRFSLAGIREVHRLIEIGERDAQE